jgi:Fe2+ or Zn2+ uptake regulation protein
MKTLQDEEQVRTWLKQAGVHATLERIAVASFLFQAVAPTTVTEIRKSLIRLFPAISAQKIYFHLKILAEAGLVQQQTSNNSPDQYQLIRLRKQPD